VSDRGDQLWVIIDRFSKMVHLISLKKTENIVENLMLVFVYEKCRLTWIPTNIVSD
jgi:hypothetical protein